MTTMSKQSTMKLLSDPVVTIFTGILLVGASCAFLINATLTVSAAVQLFQGLL